MKNLTILDTENKEVKNGAQLDTLLIVSLRFETPSMNAFCINTHL